MSHYGTNTSSQTCLIAVLLYLVTVPSGGPAEGVSGGAEAAGEEDCRIGEN